MSDRMPGRGSARSLAAWAAALVLCGLAATGCTSLVGGTCAPGYVVCGDRCVDPESDPAHCGGCGRVCTAPLTCASGVCGTPIDAGSFDAGDAPPSDAPGLDAGPFDAGDAPGPDAPGLDAPLDAPELDAPGLDAPGLDAPGVDGGPPCIAPLVACAGLCVDRTTDPEHCGRCGNVCPAGLCNASACVAAFAGHVVVIGHDYETSRMAMQRVVGNAVFLPPTTSVSVLVWRGAATPASLAGTDAAIDATAALRGRVWTTVVPATSADVVTLLPTVDVFLVYAQAGANNGALMARSMEWGAAIAAFVARGGVVVVLDTASTMNGGTYRVLTSSGLFTASAVTDISLSTLTVVSPGDTIAIGMPLSYRGERTTVRFTTTSMPVVIADATGGAIVVHRTFAP